MRGGFWRRLTLHLMLLCFLPASLSAQQTRPGTPIRDLPRPGFEPPYSHIGPVELRIETDVSAFYDSNVYATSTDEQDDVILSAKPRVELDWRSPTAIVHGEAYAELRKYIDVPRESSAQFGGALAVVLNPNAVHSFSTEFRYDRAIENRSDPEARAPFFASPRKIDILSSETTYSFTKGRLKFTLSPAFQKFDYLDPAESDRSLRSYRIRGRVALQSMPMALFVEAYANWRDFDLARDFSGVDRDARTYGLAVGASRELTGRIRGQLGIGLFRFDPQDPTLRRSSGFSANGNIIWTPRDRTAVTVNIFRGDVATVRSGSTGRTDTRIGVEIDQEARHNLLLNAGLSWTQSAYRGTDRRLDTIGAKLGAEYLIDRRVSLFADANFARRRAIGIRDDFNRSRFEVGLRARY